MQWFIKEQVEEVSSMSDLLSIVERCRDEPLRAEDWLARENAGGRDAPTRRRPHPPAARSEHLADAAERRCSRAASCASSRSPPSTRSRCSPPPAAPEIWTWLQAPPPAAGRESWSAWFADALAQAAAGTQAPFATIDARSGRRDRLDALHDAATRPARAGDRLDLADAVRLALGRERRGQAAAADATRSRRSAASASS